MRHFPGIRQMVQPFSRDQLQGLFDPVSVAVIGASENPGKLGFHVMKSLTSGGFQGPIIPVNPGAKEILGVPACASLLDYPGPVDVAVVVLPARQVPATFEDCFRKAVRGIVLITAGFKEIEDPAGGKLQSLITDMANQARVPVIGPNTFGMINLHTNLNASFTPEFSRLERGSISLVSQSGGISHLMAFMAMRQRVRMSKVVGLGNRLNVDFPEMVDYLMGDPDTRVIALYLEGLDEPRHLMEKTKAYRGKKPVIALKTGSADAGDRASVAHTGSMAGRHELYEGALRQSGIWFTESTESLLDLAHTLATCPFPQGPRVAILSGQAGPAMAACDVCEAEGLQVAPFSSKTQGIINDLLPPLALRTNPVDMGPAWYNSSAIQGIVRAALDDPGVDALLLLMMFASANREALPDLSDFLVAWGQRKPVVACLVSPPGIWDEPILSLENTGALVNLPTPERAAKGLAHLWQYHNLIEAIRR
jgi:acyl-CoA synthetase (NDP forming)